MNFSLSKAENEVCNYLITTNFMNKEIADKLCVSEKTVKFHISSIYKKTGCQNRYDLILKMNGTILQYIPKEETKSHEEKIIMEHLPTRNNPMPVEKKGLTQTEKVQFIDKQFNVSDTMNHLTTMMKGVTEKELSPNTVNAACNCIARMNETINTCIQAARFLNER